ncbi:MAG: L-seryl-tRNA(Sec) selenium transferase [Chloroflexi bacterium]|nr:L-seryl-tRNA(Sec) selenium transferase [Chloroflexota bacterium]
MTSELRHLPSVDRVVSDERLKRLEDTYPRTLLVDVVRQHLERQRRSIAAGQPCPSMDNIVESVRAQVYALFTSSLRPVINATGVILHTNLGRAPLSKEATAAMAAVASGYCNLEMEVDSRARGTRQAHVELGLCQLTGAEAALAVNNNASALLLALAALAKKREVIVSRGQAVEIGGGFRIPDVMRQSGARLVEVGTANYTYVSDYEQAITPRTAALMRVHASNFKLIGFTQQVSLAELVALGRRYGLPVLDDLGSGCLLDTTAYGLDPEPMLQESVAAGAGLVFASGDKLLGGPQAGVVVGSKELVDRLKNHSLARVVRIDKARLAGLAATLIHYLKGEAISKIPVWRMISAPLAEIDRRARSWAEAGGELASVIDGETMVGGGSLPGAVLPTKLVAIGQAGKKGKNATQLVNQRLVSGEFPIIGRVSGNMLLLDPRSVLPEDDRIVLEALSRIGTGLESV